MRVTLDSNAIVDLEEGRPSAPIIRELIASQIPVQIRAPFPTKLALPGELRDRQAQDTRTTKRYVRCWSRTVYMGKPIFRFQHRYRGTGSSR
jgi:hypothetical protein